MQAAVVHVVTGARSSGTPQREETTVVHVVMDARRSGTPQQEERPQEEPSGSRALIHIPQPPCNVCVGSVSGVCWECVVSVLGVSGVCWECRECVVSVLEVCCECVGSVLEV